MSLHASFEFQVTNAARKGPIMTSTRDDEAIDRRIAELDEDPGWYQDIELPDGRRTKTRRVWGEEIDHPRKRFAMIAPSVPDDMSGLSVLDIGCNAGHFAFQAADRGATDIVGVDYNPGYIEQAKFCAEVRDQDVDFRVMDIYDLPTLDRTFDFVFCVGILYHCRYIMQAIESVCRVSKATLAVETAIHPGHDEHPLVRFVPASRYEGPDAAGATRLPGHWHPNMTALRDLLLECGFANVHEIFRDGRRGCVVATRQPSDPPQDRRVVERQGDLAVGERQRPL